MSSTGLPLNRAGAAAAMISQQATRGLASRRTQPWFTSLWCRASFAATFAAVILVGVTTGASPGYLIGQVLLGLSAYLSLWMLADRPLINPLQFAAALVYWFFGLAPTAGAISRMLQGDYDRATAALVSSERPLWLVAAGLPLFALGGNLALGILARTGWHAKFLMPAGKSYQFSTVMIFLAVGGAASLILILLAPAGGLQSVNFLGGVQTNIWWFGVIGDFTKLLGFGISGALFRLISDTSRDKTARLPTLAMGVVVVVVYFLQSITSGSKGAIVVAAAFVLLCYVIRKQRVPVVLVTIGVTYFSLVVYPFVHEGRGILMMRPNATVADRVEVYRGLIEQGRLWTPASAEDSGFEGLSRGIYPYANVIMERNGILGGEWGGETISWGLQANVPRAFFPEKPEMNVGNYFYKALHEDAYGTRPTDDLTNVSVGIPFEFVGNYGYLAGLLAFAGFGFFIGISSGWLLSVERFGSHPLTPLLAMQAMGIELALGAYITAAIRSWLIPLVVVFVIWVLRGKRL